MKEMVRYGFILAVICLIAGASLAGMNALTKDKIMAQEKAEEEASLKEVMPQAVKFQAVMADGEVVYYRALDLNEKFIGIAFKASAKGYSSLVQTMAGYTCDGKITAIKILSQNETPGLGAQVAEPHFTEQFRNKNIEALSQVQAITGATISSRAVIDAVRQRAQELKERIKDER